MNQPLLRKRIVVTRALEQAQELISALSSLGADVVHIPTIRFAPPESWTDCDEAICKASRYDWLIFTSTNGVDFFYSRMRELGKDWGCFSDVKYAAVGVQTAEKLRQIGVRVDLVPDDFHAEGLADAFSAIDLKGARILLLKPEKSSSTLARGLARAGAIVDAVTVYRTEAAPVEPARLAHMLKSGSPDLLTFTSPSTAKNLISQLGLDVVQQWLQSGCKVAAIGDVTAGALSKLGIEADIVAKKSTIHYLVNQIAEFFQNGKHTQE